MQQFSNLEISEITSRIDQIQQLLVSRTAAPAERDPGAIPTPPDMVERIAFNIEVRRMRRSHFPGAQMGGASWGMMLDLMLARANGRRLSASDLSTGAEVPLSSGLRMIAALEQQGYVQRTLDEKDRRRSIVRLTEEGVSRMTAFFDAVANAWLDRQRRAA